MTMIIKKKNMIAPIVIPVSGAAMNGASYV